MIGENIEDLSVLKPRLAARDEEIRKLHRDMEMQREETEAQIKSLQTDNERLKRTAADLRERGDRAELYMEVMAHDINNLNMIALGNLELLQPGDRLTEEERTSLDSVAAAVRGSANIIGNVRKIQAIASDSLTAETLDLDDLIRQSIEEVRYPSDRTVKISYSGSRGKLIAGTSLTKDLFRNLIDNAIKYSGPETSIDIAVGNIVAGETQTYQVSVTDNGIGIPDFIKPRLFRQLQPGTSTTHGRGLGLFIVRMLAERSGGTVRVENRVPGDHSKGSRFVVRLPAAGGRASGIT